MPTINVSALPQRPWHDKDDQHGAQRVAVVVVDVAVALVRVANPGPAVGLPDGGAHDADDGLDSRACGQCGEWVPGAAIGGDVVMLCVSESVMDDATFGDAHPTKRMRQCPQRIAGVATRQRGCVVADAPAMGGRCACARQQRWLSLQSRAALPPSGRATRAPSSGLIFFVSVVSGSC